MASDDIKEIAQREMRHQEALELGVRYFRARAVAYGATQAARWAIEEDKRLGFLMGRAEQVSLLLVEEAKAIEECGEAAKAWRMRWMGNFTKATT